MTQQDLPAPLVPSEVDLTDFPYMELDVRRLRDSRFAAAATGEAFRCGVLLWCAAWHNKPAGSLPNDDVELAHLAGFGRFPKEWKKIREQVMAEWTLCDDGRLYHPVVCEKAMIAWGMKLRHQWTRACERLRKENKARHEKQMAALPIPAFEEWEITRKSAGNPPDGGIVSGGKPEPLPNSSGGIPAEKFLERNGTERNGTGTETDRRGSAVSLRSTSDPKSLPPTASPGQKKAKSAKAEPETRAVWEAYATAYFARYGVPPVRNAKVNSQLAQLVQRLGAGEAPAVAAAYVRHNNATYIRGRHGVDLLLRDAEGLRTDWARNTQTTSAGAQIADRTQTNANAFAPLIAEAEERERRERETAQGAPHVEA